MRTRAFFLFILLCLVSLRINAEGIQFELLRVAHIDVCVQNLPPDLEFDPDQVRALMSTKAGNLFSQSEFDCDLKCLVEEYDQVEPLFEISNGELFISLNIWLKPVIRNIIFCGNDRLNSKKLRRQLDIEEGSVFERNLFLQEFNKLKVFYVKRGYFEADFDFEIVPIPETNEIDIRILIIEGRAGRIKKLDFCGITRAEQAEICELVCTKRYQFLFSWFTHAGCYNDEMIEHDRMVILNYLQNEGYADANVAITIAEDECSDKIILVITIDKGIRYRFGKICINGNTLFTDEEVFDQFDFMPRDCFSPEKLRCSIKAIRDLYGAEGYIDTTIDAQLCLREDLPLYDLNVTIEEGEQYFVGLIKVFGNCVTQTGVILHESLLCPGDVFDIRLMEGTERRLGNSGFFQTVNVYAVKTEETLCEGRLYRDIYIEVEETDTGNLGLFFGFSSLENIFGGAEITERNFNIKGIGQLWSRGPAALRGGGEFAHIKANIGKRTTTYLLQWTKPYFLDTPWIVGFDLEKSNNRALSAGYEIKTYGGNVHGTYMYNCFLKYGWHYRARHTNNSVRAHSSSLLEQEAAISGFISAAGVSVIYDSTDHPRRPTSGLRSRFDYELAGLGGNFQFMKFGYCNTFYYPVWSRGVLKFRGDIIFIHTWGNTVPTSLPLSERLYLGGETTVRGFRPYIIGPKFGPNEPRGGVSSYLLSEEFQQNLIASPCIDGFVFVDAGFVSLSQFTLGRQQASVGFGLRVELMRNLPFTIGMGYPIHPNPHEKQNFFFSIGGNF